MSSQDVRWHDQFMSLPPFSLGVRRWTPWAVWLVVLPLIILGAIQFSR